MLRSFGLSSPSITIYTKVTELVSQEAANFILRADLSLQSVQRTQ
jgi:hypothetical protein